MIHRTRKGKYVPHHAPRTIHTTCFVARIGDTAYFTKREPLKKGRYKHRSKEIS